MEVIVFPNAGTIVIDHLTDQLPVYGETCPVVHTVPAVRPAKFVKVIRTGGVRETLVSDGAQLTIEAWAAGPTAAEALAQLARGVIGAMQGTVIDGVPIYRVEEFGGPVDLPDPDSAQARYTFTVSVQVRGSVLA